MNIQIQNIGKLGQFKQVKKTETDIEDDAKWKDQDSGQLLAKKMKHINIDTLSPAACSHVVRILLVAEILKTLSQLGRSHRSQTPWSICLSLQNLDTLSPTARSHVVRVQLVAEILQRLSQIGCSHCSHRSQMPWSICQGLHDYGQLARVYQDFDFVVRQSFCIQVVLFKSGSHFVVTQSFVFILQSTSHFVVWYQVVRQSGSLQP